MQITNLLTDTKAQEKINSDLIQIDEYKDSYFYDGLLGALDNKSIEIFDTIKTWQPIYTLSDNYIYANEIVFLLSNNSQYAVFHNYNAGGSVLDTSQAMIANDKNELKEMLSKMFTPNGLDPVTDKRISPRFDFDNFVDNLPDLNVNKKLKM